MKKLFFLVISCLVYVQAQSTILRLNNNSGVTGTYLTAQLAQNAASAGDTIHVETSVSSYGSVVCNKPLVWIGPGYFLDATKASYLDNVTLTTGSAGTVLMGLYLNDLLIQTSGISVNRCCLCGLNFYATSANLCNNFSMSQSYVRCATSVTNSNACSGFTFTNSVFYGNFVLPSNFTNIVYSQNYFHSFGNGLAAVANNNIFYNYTNAMAVYASNAYNNLFVGSFSNNNYVGMNGNIYSSTTLTLSNNTVFIGAVSASSDTWLTLKSGSPALNNGLGGTNIGPSGGTSFYRYNGIPPVPNFSQFQIQAAPVNNLPVIISTKSNN